MTELKQLKDHELTLKIKSLAQQERKLTKAILEHIAEVDRRKLFLAMAYSCLYDYLTKEIGYSSGAAQRRIDAARLLLRIPEVSHKIESGAIHLAQISKLQKICRQIKRDSGAPVNTSAQKQVLEKLEHQNSLQTDLILAKEFNVEIKQDEKKHIQRDESVRIELTFTKEEMALLKKAQELLSHTTGGNLKKTLLQMAQKLITSHTPKPRAATVAVKKVTPRLRRDILYRDQSCQYRDQKTGKVCGSTYLLQADHIKPQYVGGGHSPENLRTLCKNHNQYRYVAEQTSTWPTQYKLARPDRDDIQCLAPHLLI